MGISSRTDTIAVQIGAPAADSRRRGRMLAVGLFLLSPLVGEFLLGNQPITGLAGLIVLAPMYGGGALLIRELARRTGRGWPTIVVLAVAYGLLEEAIIDQMLFNPGYLGLESFAGWGEIPGIGTSAVLLEGTVTLHTVWSICVPIAIIESFARTPTRPWLRRPGLIVTGVAFVADSALLGVFQAADLDFIATVPQLVGSSLVIAALVVLAFHLTGQWRHRDDRPAPRPLLVGLAAFGLTGVYWGQSVLVPDLLSEWLSVAWWFVPAGVAVIVVTRWSRRNGWGRRHVLALASGALLTYVWAGFYNIRDIDDVSPAVGLVGNLVFGLAAVVLVLVAERSVGRHLESTSPR